MGYNTLVTMKVADLRQAAEDPIYNERLVSSIRLSNADLMGDMGPIRGPGGAVHARLIASELKRLPEMDYDIQVAPSTHSMMTSIAAVSDAGLSVVSPVAYGATPEVAGGEASEGMRIMAETYAGFGYNVEGQGELFEGSNVEARTPISALDAEWARMGKYDADVLDEGHIFLQ